MAGGLPAKPGEKEPFDNPGLRDLDAEISDATTVTIDGQPAAIALPTLYEKNRGFIAMGIAGARDFVSIATGLKSLRATLTDTNVNALAEAWAKVASKHGRDLSALIGDYGEELAAVMVTFGIFRTVKAALDLEVAAKVAAAEAVAQAAAAVPTNQAAAPV